MEVLAVTGAIELASRVSSQLGGSGAGTAVKTAGTLMSGKSLVDVASVARVEPITMVDADCINLPEINDIMQTMHSMFSGYYLQAVNMMGTIGGVSVASKLAPLNPNRSLGFEALHLEGKHNYSLEAYKHRLPLSKHKAEISMEAQAVGQAASAQKERDLLQVENKAIDSIKEAANLSVGKMFNVQIKVDNASATVPVSIRLMVNVIPTRMMVELFTYKDGFDMDMKERYHAWRSGRLAFVKDLILCNDLIDKRRKAGIKDPSGILQQINNRESKNVVASFMNGRASVATSSNLAILSNETLEEVEMQLNGNFSNHKVRTALFENTNLMILAVVDKAWERVTFYTRGIEASTSSSFKDLKVASKSGGTEVLDIMRAYMSGANPSMG